MNTTVSTTASELARAEADLARVYRWSEPIGELGRKLMQAHLEADHKWTVTPDDAESAPALKAMHLRAHRDQVNDLRCDLELETEAERSGELIPDPADRALAESTQGLYAPEEDPDYQEWSERQSHMCPESYNFGPAHDPSSAGCDHGAGHYPHTPHSSKDPLGEGTGTVTWRGGGTCAGDPLRYSEVEWTQP